MSCACCCPAKEEENVGDVDWTELLKGTNKMTNPFAPKSQEIAKKITDKRLGELANQEKCAELFKAWDLDDNEHLTADELLNIGTALKLPGASSTKYYNAETNRRVFSQLDADDNGSISQEEFAIFMYQMFYEAEAIPAAERAEAFGRFKQTGAEQKQLVHQMMQRRRKREDEFKVVFNAWDLDENGFIDHEEFHNFCCKLHQDEDGKIKWTRVNTDAMFKRFETDGDNRISLDEFLDFLGEAFADHTTTDERFEKYLAKFTDSTAAAHETKRAEDALKKTTADIAQLKIDKEEAEKILAQGNEADAQATTDANTNLKMYDHKMKLAEGIQREAQDILKMATRSGIAVQRAVERLDALRKNDSRGIQRKDIEALTKVQMSR